MGGMASYGKDLGITSASPGAAELSFGPASDEARRKFMGEAPQYAVQFRSRLPSYAVKTVDNTTLSRLYEAHPMIATVAQTAMELGFRRIGSLAEAIQGLVIELFEDPESLNVSSLRTTGNAIETLSSLLASITWPEPIPAKPHLILSVDDELLTRRAVCASLESAHLRCISVGEPEHALRLLAENPFDLIFMDVEMPGKTGLQLCSELRQLPSNKTTPVIFVTSLSGFNVRAHIAMTGGNDMIGKPFLMNELAVKALTYLAKPPAKAG